MTRPVNQPLRQLLAVQLQRLAAAHPGSKYRQNTQATLEAFEDVLNGLALDAIEPAVTDCLKECDYWPSPAELRKATLAIERRRRDGIEAAWRARDVPLQAPTTAETLTCPQCPGGRCRMRYYKLENGTERLLPEHEARGRGLELAAGQSGTPWPAIALVAGGAG